MGLHYPQSSSFNMPYAEDGEYKHGEIRPDFLNNPGDQETYSPIELTRNVKAIWRKTDQLDMRVESLSINLASMTTLLSKIDERTERTSTLLARLVEGDLLLPKCAERAKELEYVASSLKTISSALPTCAACETTVTANANKTKVDIVYKALRIVGWGTIGTILVLFITALWNMVTI